MRTETEIQDEAQRSVIDWRYGQLRRAGADRHTARIVAEQFSVSLHDALELLSRGCSPDLMMEILL